jgi:hypothetical protein
MHIFRKLQQSIDASPTKKPMILFDVDDTLIDCRHRKHTIFMDFLKQDWVRDRWPKEADLLGKLGWRSVHYRVQDNLAFLKIAEKSFADTLTQFWFDHYFSYSYLIQDIAFPRALEFVMDCQRLGAHTVYLTARDMPAMGQATFDTLEKLGFPVRGDDIHFVLKPVLAWNDHEFKVQALDDIARMGNVIAALENELPNLNAMADRFPEAAMYWRDTLFAPDPPAPHARVETLSHFP